MFAEGLVWKDSRADWRLFERMVEEYAASCLAKPTVLCQYLHVGTVDSVSARFLPE